jgi:hypothetical protein
MRITWGAKYDHLPQKLPHEIRITSFLTITTRDIPITIWLGVHGIYANSSITDEGGPFMFGVLLWDKGIKDYVALDLVVYHDLLLFDQ